MCKIVRIPKSAHSLGLLLAALLMPLGVHTQLWAQVDPTNCPLGDPKGDYLKPGDKGKIAYSGGAHFTPQVEALIRGQSNEKIGRDIDFMLRNFPNHHRALVAMMRLGEKERTPQPNGASYSISCYFDRAVRFRPDDTVARMLYATYLSKNGRRAEASAQLEAAAKAAQDNPFTQYNVGLIYLEMKDYDKALEQAHKAYALGFPRAELRDLLKSAGHWKEPAPAAASDAASNAAAAPASAASSSN
jgi:tetratricopeptide (TPR) repeat protein